MGKIWLSCPACGANLYVAGDKAGRQAKCPRCGATVEIPLEVDHGAIAQTRKELKQLRRRVQELEQAVARLNEARQAESEEVHAVLKTQGLKLVTPDGKTQAELYAPFAGSQFSPSLGFFDGGETLRALVGIVQGTPSVLLFGEDGKLQLGLQADHDGPRVYCCDEVGNPRAAVLYSDGEPRIRLCDEDGEPFWGAPEHGQGATQG